MNEQDLLELNNFSNIDHFTEIEKAILQYATEMTQTPVRICDVNFEKLKAEFSDQQLVELTSGIAWENFRARFNHGFGIGSADFCDVANASVESA